MICWAEVKYQGEARGNVSETRVKKRLSKEERRDQLLAVAREIVREDGTEGLTLAMVAERSGVTKPVAYEHFGSREGLLIALYETLDAQQMAAAEAALAAGEPSLAATARVLSQSYVDCCLSAGPEFSAISAALEGSEAMQSAKETLRRAYYAQLRKAFAPFVKLPAPEARALPVAIVAAADAIAGEAADGRISRAAAVRLLTGIITGAMAPYAVGV
ncbi:MAG: TetR/AcrR family transcriptional regulator [Parvibaculaceae bacterium]